jgi:CRP-like cAMP-binding protein
MKNFIAFFDRFQSLSTRVLDLMAKFFIYDELKKGEYFIKEGQYAKEIAFLETGIVRAFYINKKGQEYNKHFFVAPSIIGSYASLISKQENEVPQQALTDCKIWKAPFDQIEELSKNNSEIEHLRRVIAENIFLKHEKKEIEMALLDASERYLIFKQQFPDVERQIPQYHIASYLGVSPTQLSRVKRKIHEEKHSSLPM